MCSVISKRKENTLPSPERVSSNLVRQKDNLLKNLLLNQSIATNYKELRKAVASIFTTQTSQFCLADDVRKCYTVAHPSARL